MPALPVEIVALLGLFASEFTTVTFEKIKLLFVGSMLCQGARRITSLLRIMGLSHEQRFEQYHRILNRAKFNSVNLSKILLGLLIKQLPASWPILIAVDDTIERRKGKTILAKGCYRDAARSSQSLVIKCFGLKWNCMALIIPLPWSTRPWALPFMTVLAPSKQANKKMGRRHKTINDWTITMVKVVCRFLGHRRWRLIADGAYACMKLANCCVKQQVTLISRMRLDAQVYQFPPKQSERKRGRKPMKGERIPLKALVSDDKTTWLEYEVNWYGGKKKMIRYFTMTCLWYQAGTIPLPMRIVVVLTPNGKNNAEVFFSTDIDLCPIKIIEYFVLRWNIEVTFEESRAHLGLETQRQWSSLAIKRTTPLLMALYSMVTLVALQLKNNHLFVVEKTAWYDKKGQATFSDALACVRRSIWRETYLSKSHFKADFAKLPQSELNLLINQLAQAA